MIVGYVLRNDERKHNLTVWLGTASYYSCVFKSEEARVFRTAKDARDHVRRYNLQCTTVVYRRVRTPKVRPGVVGYRIRSAIVSEYYLSYSGWFGGRPRTFETKQEAREALAVHPNKAPGTIVCVVRKPKAKPGTRGYVVVGKRKDGSIMRGGKYWDGTKWTDTRRVFGTYAAARNSNPVLYPSDGQRIAILAVRPKVDPTIKGWIVRKRHPHVFATRAEALTCAQKFLDPCKVVPVRDGHEALKGG